MLPITSLKNNQVENSRPDFFSHSVPIEIALQILARLRPIDVIHIRQTSKYWYQISLDEVLWKHLVNQYFPHYRWNNSNPMEVVKFCIIRQRDIGDGKYVPPALTPESIFSQFSGGVMCIAKKSGALYAATCTQIIIWSLCGNRVLDVLRHSNVVFHLTVVDDKIYLASMNSGVIIAWDCWEGKPLSPLDNFSPVKYIQEYKGYLYVGMTKGIKVWDLEKELLIAMWGDEYSVDCILTRNNLYTSSLERPIIRVRNVKDGTVLRTFQLSTPNGGIKCLALYKNTLVCGSNWCGDIHLLDLRTGAEIKVLKNGEEGIRSMQVDESLHVLYAISTHTLTIWNLLTGQIVERHKVNSDQACLSLARRDKRLYIGSYRRICVYNFEIPDEGGQSEGSNR